MTASQKVTRTRYLRVLPRRIDPILASGQAEILSSDFQLGKQKIRKVDVTEGKCHNECPGLPTRVS